MAYHVVYYCLPVCFYEERALGAHMRMTATIVSIHQCIVVSSINNVGDLKEDGLGLSFNLILIQ